LLEFLRTRTGKEPCSLLITDLDVTAILAFLDHLEEKRGNKVRSRNLRLAAIRTFFRFVALCDPERLGQVTQIMAIPVKRQEKRLISALTREEIEAILSTPDQSTWTGRRDYALLLTMYNTGARVSEMTGPTKGASQLRTVHIYQVAWQRKKGAHRPLVATHGTRFEILVSRTCRELWHCGIPECTWPPNGS